MRTQSKFSKTHIDLLIADLLRVDGRFKPGLVNKQQFVFECLGAGPAAMDTNTKVSVLCVLQVCMFVSSQQGMLAFLRRCWACIGYGVLLVQNASILSSICD